VGASIVLIGLLSPALVIVGLAVLFTSGWPIVYRGLRTGRHGDTFRILKFRTMRVGAERLGGMTTALNDPRLTTLGAWLRRYKLDELPQLVNVLVGQMSLVGPRPEMPTYTARYENELRHILCAPPGITDFASIELFDLASVVGPTEADARYEDEVLSEKNRLRLKYVQGWTLRRDATILAQTASRLMSPSRSHQTRRR
jgi:lipopolysaccharide/colanic/teichoic acid biosynthesis glycosyltransferase